MPQPFAHMINLPAGTKVEPGQEVTARCGVTFVAELVEKDATSARPWCMECIADLAKHGGGGAIRCKVADYA